VTGLGEPLDRRTWQQVTKEAVMTYNLPIGGVTTRDGVEFISVPEWCRRVGCSMDAGYRAARRNEIAGLFRIGKLMRVNWQAFVMATFGATEAAAS
jgi:hypothetical protein